MGVLAVGAPHAEGAVMQAPPIERTLTVRRSGSAPLGGGRTALPSAGRYNGSADLARKISSGELKIAVYGLGHVGSPLVSAWLRAGAHVAGVDKSPKVLENARKGRTHISEPGVNEAFSKGLKEKKWRTMKRSCTKGMLLMV